MVALKQVKLLSVKEGFPTTALREINVRLTNELNAHFICNSYGRI